MYVLIMNCCMKLTFVLMHLREIAPIPMCIPTYGRHLV